MGLQISLGVAAEISVENIQNSSRNICGSESGNIDAGTVSGE